MHIRKRKVLAVCSVALWVLATPAFADVGDSSENNGPEGPAVVLQKKADRQKGAQRQAGRRQAVQGHTAWAYAPEDAGGRPSHRQARAHAAATGSGWGSSSLVAEARRYIGTNPTKRNSLWCATFMNMVLERAGYARNGSDLARSFASYGTRVSGPQVGAIAVMTRGRNGGHVGVVSGVDPSGNPIIVSGNHNDRVAEAVYPRGRIIAYVMPDA